MNFKYHKISSKFWTDEKVINWDNDARILAIYLLTCPHRNTEGIFRLPKQYIMADLQWSLEQLHKPFAKLLNDGFIEYDERVNVMLLTRAIKYNPPQNPNQETSAIKGLKELPETLLLSRFITLAEQFAEGFAKRLIKVFGKPQALYSNSISNSNKDLCPDSESPDPAPENNDQPKYAEGSEPFKAACYLRRKILRNNKRTRVPNEAPDDMEDWAKEMVRLNRIGPVGAKESEKKGYSWEEIKKLICWCQEDKFWKSNILSAGKFREKIVQLENQMKSRLGSNHKNKASPEEQKIIELIKNQLNYDITAAKANELLKYANNNIKLIKEKILEAQKKEMDPAQSYYWLENTVKKTNSLYKGYR